MRGLNEHRYNNGRIEWRRDKVDVCFLTAGDVNYEVLAKEALSTSNKEDRFIRKPISNEELVKRVKQMTLTD